MERDRGYYRYQRRQHIARKRRIIDETHHWFCDCDGKLAKGKIHCSCWMCAFNHPKSGWKQITHSDMMKIEMLDYSEQEYQAA